MATEGNCPARGEWPLVFVILVNWNNWRDTIDCLDSLQRCSYRNFRVVVVDNGSGDGSPGEIAAWGRRSGIPFAERSWLVGRLGAARSFPGNARCGLQEVVLIQTGENLGFCGANNLAADYALQNGGEFMLILNNDTLCEPDFLDHLVLAARSEPEAGLVGGFIYEADRPGSLWWGAQRLKCFYRISRCGNQADAAARPLAGVIEASWITGCLMLIPRQVYQRIGGFCEDFFLWHEDIDLSLRVTARNYRLLVAPAARIHHKGSHSIGTLSPVAYYYASRNFLLLSRRHNNGFGHLAHVIYFLLRCTAGAAALVVKGRPRCAAASLRGLRDYFLHRFGKAPRHEQMCSAAAAPEGETAA
jgi:GT2 family glycosyltransferase